MHKFLFVGGELSSGNRGVDAITLGAMYCLQEFYPDAEFTIVGFTSPTSTTTTYQIDLGHNQIDVVEAKTSFRKGVLMSLCTRMMHRSIRNAVLEYFGKADAVVDISGGDGFSDTYGTKVLLRHSLGKLIALHLGKPLIIFPQTMGPFRTRVSRLLARYLLRRADLVCVREQISKEIVQEMLGRSGNVVCLADMAFLMQAADISTAPHLSVELPSTTKFIGFNVSGLLWNRAQKISGSDNAALDYQKMCVGMVRRLVQETGRLVVLIPHVFSENSAIGDLGACRRVQEQLSDLGDKVLLLHRDYSAPEIKAIIARCEFFVGARMHACIAALSTGTPVVPIAYSHKFAGILQQFGIVEWLIDPKHLSPEQAIELVLSGYEHREEIKERIITKLPLVKSEAMRAGQLLKDIMG